MAQEILRQGVFNVGEIDPNMRGRRDHKAYQAALEYASNIIVRPQGNIERRPGLKYIARQRSSLAAIDFDGAVINSAYEGTYAGTYVAMPTPHYVGSYTSDADGVLPNGAGFRTIVALAAIAPYVVFSIDFGVSKSVSCVDLTDYVVLAPTASTPSTPSVNYPWDEVLSGLATVRSVLQLQYQDGSGSWINFGSAQDLGTLLRSRRVASLPGTQVQARYWRLVVMGGTNFGANVFEISKIKFWEETGDFTPARKWRFTFDADEQQYLVLVTSGNGDIFRRGDYVASIALPYTDAQLRYVKRAQTFDTLISFHVDVRPQRIMRQGAHDQWEVRPASFSNIPVYDYDGTNAGGINEKQDIKFKDYADGDTFTLTYESEETTAINYITTSATNFADNIKTALEDLPSIGPGNISVTFPSTNVFRVEFINQLGGGDVSNLAGRTVNSSRGIVYVDSYERGAEGGEPIISTTRGWPATGCFYQDRLYMGGLKLRSQTILASRLGEYFDFDKRGSKSAAGIIINLSSTSKFDIIALYPGRHLQVFTNTSEFYFPTEPIVPPIPAVKLTTNRGIEPGTPLFDIDNATAFVKAGGYGLYQYMYADSEQSYIAPNYSVLWPHIVKDIVDVGFRKAQNTTDPDLALIVKSDGEGALMSALGEENVQGFVRFTTDGLIQSATGEATGTIYVTVNRDGVYTLEALDSVHMLDASVRVTGAHDEITGLEHLEGRNVHLYVDGSYDGTATVVDGRVGLTYASVAYAEAGLLFEPRCRTLPALLEDPRGGGTARPRTGTVEFDLGPSVGLQAGLKDGRMWDVPLKRRPTALLDQGAGDNPFEGWTRLMGIQGFRSEAQIEFRQNIPGPFSIRQIVISVNS